MKLANDELQEKVCDIIVEMEKDNDLNGKEMFILDLFYNCICTGMLNNVPGETDEELRNSILALCDTVIRDKDIREHFKSINTLVNYKIIANSIYLE